MRRTLLLLAFVAAATSLALGQTGGGKRGRDRVRTAIEAANERFVAAINRGDAAAVAAMYSTDAQVLPGADGHA